jgi:nitrous oxide reductase accessory protein NosL
MFQIPLSATQAVILSAACARESAMVFPVTASLKGGAVGNVCKSLLKRGLIEEIAASDLNTVWRHDEKRGPVTLRATPLAYSTLGITDNPAPEASLHLSAEPARRRAGTKQDTLIAMLRTPEGANIEEIVAATGWLRHTVRGSMSGALKKKLGLTITSEKVEGRGRVYKLPDA